MKPVKRRVSDEVWSSAEKVTTECIWCHKTFSYLHLSKSPHRQKFCSQSCRAREKNWREQTAKNIDIGGDRR